MLNYKRPFRALGLVVVVLFSFAVTSRTIGTDDCQAKNIIPNGIKISIFNLKPCEYR